MPPFPAVRFALIKFVMYWNAPSIGCQSSCRPSPKRKRKEKKSNSSRKEEQNKGSRLLLLRADRLTARSKHVLLERSLVIKRKEKPLSLVMSPLLPCIAVAGVDSYPCSFMMNYYAHAHAVDGWQIRSAANAVRSKVPTARSEHLPFCTGRAEDGNARVNVLISVRGAVICLGATSRCNGIDVFGLLTACVDNHATATL